jgi:beta-fructofuranosidase
LFRLPDAWVWDFWLADDGTNYHMFFLYASRALGDPEARHFRASIGHAVSTDLTNWHRTRDALVRADPPAFDDLATWTGSTVQHPDGTWFLFYTGATRTALGVVQTIGYATSTDLLTWTKNPANPVLRADSRRYETLGTSDWDDEAFRDPWVFPDPQGDGWHMLITARDNTGPSDNRGVIGHATSPDLRTWQLQDPLSPPGQGFAQLEVIQVEHVNGRPTLVFSCLPSETSATRQATGIDSGVWIATAQSLLGPYDLENAVPITGSSLYSGRVIRNRHTGKWTLLAFQHDPNDPTFGQICGPQVFPTS